MGEKRCLTSLLTAAKETNLKALKLVIIMFLLYLSHLYYFVLVSFLSFLSFCTPRRRVRAFFFLISTECPTLKKPRNGKLSCRSVSGKLLCIMSCEEGYSFNSEAMTMYGCGPDTNWKWNGMEELVQPTCSSE